MPVKNKRNASSRKHRSDAHPIAYTTSSEYSDAPASSAASSPPDRVPAFNFAAGLALSDTEPDAVRETMTDDFQFGTPDITVGLDPRATMRPEESPLYVESSPRQADALQALVQDEGDQQHGDLHRAQTGHVRSPVIKREPTTLESLSRTIRGYMPSSISVPSAVPTPPRLSKPVSFGSFLTPTRTATVSAHGTGSSAEGVDAGLQQGSAALNRQDAVSSRVQHPSADHIEDGVFNLDEDVHQGRDPFAEGQITDAYPGVTNGEDIVSASFSELRQGNALRRLLLLGYRSGLQAWDCTNLGSVTEVLNLSGPTWGSVESLSVLPDPCIDEREDAFRSQRPMIGFLSTTDRKVLVIYSLRTQEIVKTLEIQSIISFTATPDFMVLSTTDPPALHVLSSRTLHTLYTFPAPLLSLLTQPTHNSDTRQSVSLSVDHGVDAIGPSHNTTIPTPVFALSHRLLAFASAPPHPTSPSQAAARTPLASHAALEEAGLKFPASQAELGLTALKIGSSLFSGMKAIGGRAYSAARAGVSAAMSVEHGSGATAIPASGKFFSRSAPESSTREDERRNSTVSDAGSLIGSIPSDAPLGTPTSSRDKPVRKDRGHYVTVVDLDPLRSGQPHLSTPILVAEYMVSRHQPISRIEFSSDGASIVIALQDGLSMKVYRLRPLSRASHPRSTLHGVSQDEQSTGLHEEHESFVTSPWHIYNLRRGRTYATVEQLAWAHDGRWLAVGTRKRTIHLFALNPYGGPTDEASHLEGRVMNVSETQPLSTELTPLVRLRLPTSADAPILPPSIFTFLRRQDDLPSSLEPQSLSAVITHASSSSPSAYPPYSPNPSDSHQDILLFDPHDGTLSLNRVTLSLRRRGDLSSTIRSGSIANASISLPGVSTMSRLAGSLPTPARQPSALTRMMERTELVGDPAVIATWSLRRTAEWREIKQPFRPRSAPRLSSRRAKADWLAHAELSTCSRSRKIVPKSIYLAHQFSFHYLGDDYHALLRSRRFDVPGHRIDVRRQVAVSASGGGMSESFVSGSSVPSQGAAFSSSFDEPLASALSAELGHSNPSPPVLPMYPNGPTSARSSGRSAIPIRMATGLSDNMSESLGRLKREIGRVKPAKPVFHRGVSRSVPLEFDEEDEDFLALDPPSDTSLPLTSGDQAALSTPSTDLDPLPADIEGDEIWNEWDAEDKQTVDDAEQYDDIGVGYMDEEWQKSKH